MAILREKICGARENFDEETTITKNFVEEFWEEKAEER